MLVGEVLTCQCDYEDCDGGYISKRLAIGINDIEERIPGYDIWILSGYRCIKHNRDSGGTSNSRHMSGEAIDFTIPGLTHQEAVLILESVPYFNNGGIGVYINGKGWFVHGDVRRGKARWLYINGNKQTYKELTESNIFTL